MKSRLLEVPKKHTKKRQDAYYRSALGDVKVLLTSNRLLLNFEIELSWPQGWMGWGMGVSG